MFMHLLSKVLVVIRKKKFFGCTYPLRLVFLAMSKFSVFGVKRIWRVLILAFFLRAQCHEYYTLHVFVLVDGFSSRMTMFPSTTPAFLHALCYDKLATDTVLSTLLR